MKLSGPRPWSGALAALCAATDRHALSLAQSKLSKAEAVEDTRVHTQAEARRAAYPVPVGAELWQAEAAVLCPS